MLRDGGIDRVWLISHPVDCCAAEDEAAGRLVDRVEVHYGFLMIGVAVGELAADEDVEHVLQLVALVVWRCRELCMRQQRI